MKFIKNHKKGQMTVYVILGIVIVAILAGVFILKDYVLKSQFERDAQKFKISEDFIPLYNSYSSCVNEIVQDGITILASQGGYIEIPRYEYVPNPLIPFSNKLDFFGNSNLEIAYWFYETGNGIQTEKIPTLNEIEGDLGKYIEDNIYYCNLNLSSYSSYDLNDFESFDTKFFESILAT